MYLFSRGYLKGKGMFDQLGSRYLKNEIRMTRNAIFALLFLFGQSICMAQAKEHTHSHHTYQIDWKKDGIILGLGIGLTTSGYFLLKKSKDITAAEVSNLDILNIPSFDRAAASNYSLSAQKTSDIILYSSLALPAFSYFSHRCRSESGKIALMALETILLTNGITSIAKGTVNRFRPYAYNPSVDLETKLLNTSKKSFFSAHASNSAAFSFFVAKVITDTHPDMKNKFLIWSAAATIPAMVSYFRFKAGKHFFSDVVLGYTVGASIGFFIPQMHLNKNMDLSFLGNSLQLKLQF